MPDTWLTWSVPLCGAALGVFFYGGLWWTVRRTASSRHPALGMLASMLLRMALTLAGFFVAGAGQWQRLLLCLAGFLVGRLLVTWLVRPSPPAPPEIGAPLAP